MLKLMMIILLRSSDIATITASWTFRTDSATSTVIAC
jgi:hypothetical protein